MIAKSVTVQNYYRAELLSCHHRAASGYLSVMRSPFALPPNQEEEQRPCTTIIS
jgi:hypothetical protein